MSILPWRPVSQTIPTGTAAFRVPGAYAGRARFQPRATRMLPEVLKSVAGRVIEFGFAGVGAADGPFAGQAMYLEWRTDATLDGYLIPEQDLEFLNESADPRG
jgi:hypothetical protein